MDRKACPASRDRKEHPERKARGPSRCIRAAGRAGRAGAARRRWAARRPAITFANGAPVLGLVFWPGDPNNPTVGDYIALMNINGSIVGVNIDLFLGQGRLPYYQFVANQKLWYMTPDCSGPAYVSQMDYTPFSTRYAAQQNGSLYVGSGAAPVFLNPGSAGYGGRDYFSDKISMQWLVPVETVVDLRNAFPFPLVPGM